MSVDQASISAGGPLLQAFDAIAARGGDPRQIAAQQLAYIRGQIVGNALPFFAELRQYRPILVTPTITVVTRFRAPASASTTTASCALMGLVIGMVETTSQAAVQALLVLMANPAALVGAVAAAAGDNDDALWAHIREALRYQPVNPLVIRTLAADYTLAAGEPHATALPKGTVVFACTWSAMFDDAILETPQNFNAGRPAYHYLHFATGAHACFGRYISQVQITQILKPILQLKGLALAGPPVYAGPFPDKLQITGT